MWKPCLFNLVNIMSKTRYTFLYSLFKSKGFIKNSSFRFTLFSQIILLEDFNILGYPLPEIFLRFNFAGILFEL
jgi:hypothetical protein